jgi:heme-degrading monooxygenase HmoA
MIHPDPPNQAPGLVVLYRWRVKPGAESTFVAAWARITERLHRDHGSLGSRLHRGSDGLWYAYAQWPSAEHRRRAFATGSDPDDSRALHAAVLEALPEVLLEPVAGILE